jgi:acyl carrier protein
MMDDLSKLIVSEISAVLAVNPERLPMDQEISELGATSRELLLAIYQIEQKLGICLPDDQLSTFSTVGDVVEAVRRIQRTDAPP